MKKDIRNNLTMEEIGDLKSARKLLMSIGLATIVLYLFKGNVTELNLGFIKISGLKLFEGLPVWLLLIANMYVWIRYMQAMIYEPRQARRNIFAFYFIKGCKFENIESIGIKGFDMLGLRNIYLKKRDFENGNGNLDISKEKIDVEVGEERFYMEGVLSSPNIEGRVNKKGEKISIIFNETRNKEKEVTFNEKEQKIPQSPDYLFISNQSLQNRQVTRKETESEFKTIVIRIHRSNFEYHRNRFLYYLTERHYADYELPIIIGIIAIGGLLTRITYINLPH